MAEGNGNGGIRIPGWMWAGGVLALLGACIVVIASWFGHELNAATEKNGQQDNTLSAHETRLNQHDRENDRFDTRFDRVDVKLERILEMLGGGP